MYARDWHLSSIFIDIHHKSYGQIGSNLDQIRSIELTILNLKAPIINQAVIAFWIRLGPLGHTLHCCRRISNLDMDAVGISHVGGERDASNRNQFLLTAPLRNAQDLSVY